jgi:D-lactate dehydrogenase (cytochrome)
VLSVERLVHPVGPPPDGFEVAEGDGFTLHVNVAEKRAIAPPSLTLGAIAPILARLGLAYPPDPTEMSASLGGTVATNASGGRSFHYGPTRNWIRRLRVVLPTSEIVELRRGDARAVGHTLHLGSVEVPLPAPRDYPMPATKNAAGLFLEPGMEPIDLFIGSEGLLGIVTEIEIALVERLQHTLTVVAYFPTRDDALDFVDAGVAETRPLNYFSLEYFDGRSLDFMRPAHPDIPAAGGAVLFEIPYTPAHGHNPYPDSDTLARLRTELDRCHAIADWSVPTQRREDVRRFRHSLPEAVNDFVRQHVGKLGTDMAVPHDRFRELMDAYERESGAAGVPFLIFGHIGDDHVHLNYLPEDEAGAARAKTAYLRLARTAVRLGGTISAEHGVGKKTIPDESGRVIPYLAVQYGEPGLRAVAAVKRALDPKLVLNVGNMVPAEVLMEAGSG